MKAQYVQYKRSRFSTRLHTDRLYTASHSWLLQPDENDNLWRVGFTKFATRMLGEPVEFDYEVAVGDQVEAGQVVGWMEGFKAVTDLYCPMAGEFQGANPELGDDIALAHTDPFGRGWLYSLRGAPGDGCVDVDGYVTHLDATIDKMMGKNA